MVWNRSPRRTPVPSRSTLQRHQWLTMDSAQLVARAGGAVIKETSDYWFWGTNALESLEQGYARGYRVLQYDLLPTADGNLAAKNFGAAGAADGKLLSTDEWLATHLAGGFTPMIIADILSFMTLHSDLYIIIDTKSWAYPMRTVRALFHLICLLARQINPDILARIIPFIHDQEAYDTVKEIYDFQSMIYVPYLPIQEKAMLDFLKKRYDLPIILLTSEMVNYELIRSVNRYGKLVYVYSTNELDQMRKLKRWGVYGFFTDFITPEAFCERFSVRARGQHAIYFR